MAGRRDRQLLDDSIDGVAGQQVGQDGIDLGGLV